MSVFLFEIINAYYLLILSCKTSISTFKISKNNAFLSAEKSLLSRLFLYATNLLSNRISSIFIVASLASTADLSLDSLEVESFLATASVEARTTSPSKMWSAGASSPSFGSSVNT